MCLQALLSRLIQAQCILTLSLALMALGAQAQRNNLQRFHLQS